ncbi:MAG: dTDP-4-dehydrorhamnose reductase [Alphaproteobacteria bacterium]|nr:dTDP-4-dehydrorhamnose reductase [Alphaproteobacteria bacterium]
MILVTGGAGQLGRALAAHPGVLALDRQALDVRDARAVTATIARLRPAAVVNAAAWTAVDAAERHRSAAYAVNADGADHVARACARVDVPLVHVSTDYVFGARRGPHRPDDPTAPTTVYGASKRAGEVAVLAAGGRAAIVRTAWLFGPGDDGFVGRIVARARRGTALRVVADQWGNPTPTGPLARVLLALVADGGDDLWRTWHAAGGPATTWHGLATEAVAVAGCRVPVGAIPTGAWPVLARRGLDTRLDTSDLDRRLGLPIAWRPALDAWRGACGAR